MGHPLHIRFRNGLVALFGWGAAGHGNHFSPGPRLGRALHLTLKLCRKGPGLFDAIRKQIDRLICRLSQGRKATLSSQRGTV